MKSPYYYPPLTKEEVLSVSTSDITVGQQREILEKLARRWDYIVMHCLAKEPDGWWVFGRDPGHDNSERTFLDGLVDDGKQIKIHAELHIKDGLSDDCWFPVSWSWEECEDLIVAEIREYYESIARKKAASKAKADRKRARIKEAIAYNDSMFAIADDMIKSIQSKLTDEELNFLKWRDKVVQPKPKL